MKPAPLNLRHRSRVLSGLIMLGSVGLTACATSGAPISGERSGLSPQERRLQDTENAMVTLKRRVDGLDATINDGGGNLQNEVRELRGQVEQLTFQVQQQEQRSKQIFAELEQRVRRAEGGGAALGGFNGGMPPPLPGLGGSGPDVGASPSPSVSRPAAKPAFDADEEASYLATFELLKNGKYDDAIVGFRQHLGKYPDGQYSDNASYWMAEASFVKRDFQTARSGFETVVTKFPDSPRAPDAMFKLALAQEELKQSSQARSTLQRVVSRYPNSNAARLAQQRLDANRQ